MAGSGLRKVQLGNGQGVADAVAAFGNELMSITLSPITSSIYRPRHGVAPTIRTTIWLMIIIYQVGEMWGLENDASKEGRVDADVDAPKAWNAAVQAAGRGGSMGVAVAIIDSGIDDTHPDLYLNTWVNQGEIPQTLRDQGLRDTDEDRLVTFRDLSDAANTCQTLTTTVTSTVAICGSMNAGSTRSTKTRTAI